MDIFRHIIKTAEPQIPLTGKEKEIFSFLQNILDFMRQNGVDTQVRVSGGWVRDKLMGKDSDDIDIAVENMTGLQFADWINKYNTAHKQITGENLPELGKMFVIPKNPEKSKTLETTSIYILGEKIDLVNLREEKYNEKSRVPEMTLATGPDAEEKDAYRRDLTINSMFYNIETGLVEDYAGGIKDLENKILRTPLEPKKTFSDDPLRMVRLLRFKGKFPDFNIDPPIIDALYDPEVQKQYQKIDKKRAWPELKKLFRISNPAEPMKIFLESGLYKNIFNVPGIQQLPDLRMDQRNSKHAYDLLNHTVHVMDEYSKLLDESGADPDTRVIALMAAMFHDLGKALPGKATPHKNPKRAGEYQYLGHEKDSAEIAREALSYIGMGNIGSKMVGELIESHMEPHLWKDAPENFTPVPQKHRPHQLSRYYEKMHEFIDRFNPVEMGKERKDAIPSRPYGRAEMANLAILHSLADTKARNIEAFTPEEGAYYRTHQENLKQYYPYWEKAAQRSFLSGGDVCNHLGIPPTFHFSLKEGDPPVKAIDYIQSELRRQQAKGEIENEAEAWNYIDRYLAHRIKAEYQKSISGGQEQTPNPPQKPNPQP